jgi:hypothetical protein
MYLNSFALASGIFLLVAGFQARAVTSCTAGNPNTTSVVETTPTTAFVNNNDGTVTHGLTGLMWKQCAQGLSGAACTSGTPLATTWSAALAVAVADTTAGHADWRLPNKKELQSIVESCGFGPAINQIIFPATPGSLTQWFFWSSSSYFTEPAGAAIVSFSGGQTGYGGKSTLAHVRLVRGGRSFDSFDAQHPTAIKTVLDADASINESQYDALTDGLLIIRYLFGLAGPSLTSGALGAMATRTEPAAVTAYLDGVRTSLDIDGNGIADALTDGLLMIRYLFGLRGTSLVSGAVDSLGTRPTAQDIEPYLRSLMP